MSLEHLEKASKEIDEELPSYKRARKYYEGLDSSEFLIDQFNEFFKTSEDFSGTLNYASIPVDAVADRLQLLSIKGPTDAITEQITELWNANKMPLRFGQFILNTLSDGDNFISVWPEDDEESDLLNHKAKMMFADGATTRAFYDDGGELIFVARKWEDLDVDEQPIFRMNLYYPDYIEKYFWQEKDSVEQAQPWLDEEDSEWPMVNPYNRIPLFHFATGFPTGQPEHQALYGVQDAINKIFQTHIASIEYLGFPIIYTLMDETNAAGSSDFNFDPIDNLDDSVDDVNKLKNSPGEVWALRAKSVGQLEPAGSGSFIESLKQYKEIASEISGLPARLFSSTDGQHPGADAVNAADAVLRQRVVDRSILLSESLKQVVSFALLLAFNIEVTPNEISILWRPQKIEIDSSVINVMKFKLAIGIPPRQILSEMGYTDAEINQFLGENNDGREMVADILLALDQQEQQVASSPLNQTSRTQPNSGS